MKAESWFGKSSQETPLQQIHLGLARFFLFFFLGGPHVFDNSLPSSFLPLLDTPLTLSLCVIYVCRQQLDVRKLFPRRFSRFYVFAACVWRRQQQQQRLRPAPPGRQADVWLLVYLPGALEEPSND